MNGRRYTISESSKLNITSPVMSFTSVLNRECKKFYQCLAEMIRSKRGTGYKIVVACIKNKVTSSFKKKTVSMLA